MSPLTVEEVKELLGIKKIPGSAEEVGMLIQWAQDIADERGRDYLKKHRERLLGRWKYMLQFGVSRI